MLGISAYGGLKILEALRDKQDHSDFINLLFGNPENFIEDNPVIAEEILGVSNPSEAYTVIVQEYGNPRVFIQEIEPELGEYVNGYSEEDILEHLDPDSLERIEEFCLESDENLNFCKQVLTRYGLTKDLRDLIIQSSQPMLVE